MATPAPIPQHTRHKLEQIFKPDYPICKEDVIWVLELIKKKVAEEDPMLLDLSQPRLLKSYHYFAEMAMMLVHRRHLFDQEADRLRAWLIEAASGIIDLPPSALRKARY
ncbi:hypothetical protein [Paenibacillus chartarius]|uniref:hypothetical protein n=1 Tax=Paenibacillus chartarius TaxID=747481 RepID=UPI0036707C4E